MAKQGTYFGPDLCNTEGARILKNRIEQYWRDRGFEIDVKMPEAGFVAAMRSARTDVRSDMVNGFPIQKRADRRPAPVPTRFSPDQLGRILQAA